VPRDGVTVEETVGGGLKEGHDAPAAGEAGVFGELLLGAELEGGGGVVPNDLGT